jgi:hypothetical protein
MSVSSANLKLARANRHIRDLENLCEAFIAENPHRLVCENDPKNRMAFVRVVVTKQIPMEASTIIGDALHNLRSSLDHLAAIAIRHAGNQPTRETQFPVGGTPADLEAAIPRKLHGASDAFIRFVREAKPYRDGGDGVVFPLSRLDNLDKHDSIIPSLSVHRVHNIVLSATNPNGCQLHMTVGVVEARGGSINLAAMQPGATMELNKDTYGSFQIEFQQTGILDGEPIIDTLKAFSARCSQIVSTATF